MADIGFSRDEPGQWIPLEVLTRDAEILIVHRLLSVSRLPSLLQAGIPSLGLPGEPDPAESPPPPLS